VNLLLKRAFLCVRTSAEAHIGSGYAVFFLDAFLKHLQVKGTDTCYGALQ